MSVCSVEGCNREVICKDLCQRHYMRLRRTGRLDTVRKTGSFWEKVQKGSPTDCWPWTGFRKSSGHGLTSIKGHPMHTSRKAWILTHGPIADDMQVLHKCDNAVCCNPDHMYLGTRIDNILDRWEQPAHEDRGARDAKRRFMLTDEQLGLMWEMRKHGATLRECAAKFNVHMATVARYITAVRKQRLQELRARVTRKSTTESSL